MTTQPVPAGGDPRQLLDETRGLARQVRLDQRLTWVALLVLAAVTFLAIPFDYFGMDVRCEPNGGPCWFDRQGMLWYWPFALVLAYGIITYAYIRAARERGLGARVMPFAITGGVLTGVFLAAWIGVRIYLHYNPVPANPTPADATPEWVLFFSRMVEPAGTIGLALLVLVWVERNLALLAFTLAYLAIVLVPINFGWHMNASTQASFLPEQIINGTVLLLGAAGFALARRRRT